jgi:hypothetical protein
MANSPLLIEYVQSCDDPLLKKILECYSQHQNESKETASAHLTSLFSRLLEERINEQSDD